MLQGCLPMLSLKMEPNHRLGCCMKPLVGPHGVHIILGARCLKISYINSRNHPFERDNNNKGL